MNTNQSKAATRLPTGTEIYDAIMGGIEPDLTSTVIKTLPEKYKGESPEETRKRFARYDVAFAEYEKRYGAYLLGVKVRADACRKSARAHAEEMALKDDASREQHLLQSIEQS